MNLLETARDDPLLNDLVQKSPSWMMWQYRQLSVWVFVGGSRTEPIWDLRRYALCVHSPTAHASTISRYSCSGFLLIVVSFFLHCPWPSHGHKGDFFLFRLKFRSFRPWKKESKEKRKFLDGEYPEFFSRFDTSPVDPLSQRGSDCGGRSIRFENPKNSDWHHQTLFLFSLFTKSHISIPSPFCWARTVFCVCRKPTLCISISTYLGMGSHSKIPIDLQLFF